MIIVDYKSFLISSIDIYGVESFFLVNLDLVFESCLIAGSYWLFENQPIRFQNIFEFLWFKGDFLVVLFVDFFQLYLLFVRFPRLSLQNQDSSFTT